MSRGSLAPLLYEDAVHWALAEDLGRAGDITTDATVPVDRTGQAAIVARAYPSPTRWAR